MNKQELLKLIDNDDNIMVQQTAIVLQTNSLVPGSSNKLEKDGSNLANNYFWNNDSTEEYGDDSIRYHIYYTVPENIDRKTLLELIKLASNNFDESTIRENTDCFGEIDFEDLTDNEFWEIIEKFEKVDGLIKQKRGPCKASKKQKQKEIEDY